MGSGSSSLEDRLFDAVETQLGDVERHHASKITGMLLELGSEQVETLLASEELLQSSIARSLKACHSTEPFGCPGRGQEGAGEGPEDLLYEKVEKMCPDHAAKITGMLLELDSASLVSVLASDSLLRSVVWKAQQVCKGTMFIDPSATQVQQVCKATTCPDPRKTQVKQMCKNATCPDPRATQGEQVCKGTMCPDPRATHVDQVCRNTTCPDPRVKQVQQVCRNTTCPDPRVTQVGQVCKATTCLDPRITQTGCIDSQKLGESVFERVKQIHPDCAEQITGMILEHPETQLQQVLDDEELLLQYIHTAYKVLKHSR